MLFDAHNHLQFTELAPHLDQIVTDLTVLSWGGAVVNGTHPNDDWSAVTALAARFAWVIPSYGIHPWDVGLRPSDWQATFAATLSAHPRAAVGEIGLDTLILSPTRQHKPTFDSTPAAPIEEQMEVFAWQLRWAAEHDRPASIHCVRAWPQLQSVFRTTPTPRTGFLLHAYSGAAEQIPALVEQGAYFSFNTSHLDPRKTRQRAAFQAVPLDRLLVETDAPAMLPPEPTHLLPLAPDGSQLNHPANLAAAYAGLAHLRQLALPDMESQIAENFVRLFGIDPI